LSENLSILNLENKTVYLIGTAHVSSDSADEAYSLIQDVKPDIVCIELDDERMQSMADPEAWKNTNIAEVIRKKKSSFLFVNIILSSYQKRLANQFDISAGQEMIVSMRAADEIGAKVVGIDRNIKTTFMRIWRNLGMWEKCKLFFSMILNFVSDEEISEEDLAELKQMDMLESALSELAIAFPTIKKYLVDERDLYLASSIQACDGDVVVAVVGAAHRPGIIKHIGEDIDKEDLDSVPPASKIGPILGWSIPTLLVVMMVWTMVINPKAGLEQLRQFSLYTSILASLGTLLAGGHIYSVLTSLVMAPFTAIHPLLAVGWFAGLVEATMRKPKVVDFETLSDDLASFKGLWQNKVTKVLLVVMLANIGGTIGTFMGGLNIFKIFTDFVIK
jgi:pheromone shutdown-related protein TraB